MAVGTFVCPARSDAHGRWHSVSALKPLRLLVLCGGRIRPVHLLRVVLLRVLESNFPGDPLSNSTDMRMPTL